MQEFATVGKLRVAVPKKIKVVIVDDQLADFFERLIKAHSNWFEFQKFKNGDDAWEALSEEDPDLLITDLFHPGLDGFELLCRLSFKSASFPILVTTTLTSHAEIKKFYPSLNTQVLTKPFASADLFNYLSATFEHLEQWG